MDFTNFPNKCLVLFFDSCNYSNDITAVFFKLYLFYTCIGKQTSNRCFLPLTNLYCNDTACFYFRNPNIRNCTVKQQAVFTAIQCGCWFFLHFFLQCRQDCRFNIRRIGHNRIYILKSRGKCFGQNISLQSNYIFNPLFFTQRNVLL